MTTTNAIHRLRAASRQMVRELGMMGSDCLASGLTHAEFHALLEIHTHAELGVGALGEMLCMDQPNTSRLVKRLKAKGLIRARTSRADSRRTILQITASGRAAMRRVDEKAQARVASALLPLSGEERTAIISAVERYAGVLRRSRQLAECTLRPIEQRDNAAVAAIIRQVMTEYGATAKGFAIHDAEVGEMFEAYQAPRSRYFVVERAGVVVGAGGFAPLTGGDGVTCEIRKMYLLPEARGFGVGRMVLERCLAAARKAGFRRAYLETTPRMQEAQRLYRALGFRSLKSPMGNTGHCACGVWYARKL